MSLLLHLVHAFTLVLFDMFGFGNLICFSLLLPFGSALSSLHGMDAGRAVHLPIYRKDLSKLDKRDGEIAAIGLGDVLDM